MIFKSVEGARYSPALSLGNYTLTVGAGGIVFDQLTGNASIHGGEYSRLISDSGYVNFDLKNGGHIDMVNVSVGSSAHKVGMRILGSSYRYASSVYAQMGVWIHGDLVLDGALFFFYQENSGVKGDVFLKNRAELKIQDSNPLARDTTVTLQDASVLRFQTYYKSINSTIKSIVVERGGGQLWFEDHLNEYTYLFLDDLIISGNSYLTIYGIGSELNLFVRKSSAHIYDSLSRISIVGKGRVSAKLENYNSEYWRISWGVIPEPATYGAIFGAVGLGLAVWAKRRRAVTKRGGGGGRPAQECLGCCGLV